MSKQKPLYRWPKRLPSPFFDYSYAPQNAFLRTQMQSGRARHRQTSKTIATKINAVWKIPRADMQDFRNFVFIFIGRECGWGEFLIPLMFDDELKDMKARFCNPEAIFEAKNEQNTVYIVSAQLEVFDLHLMQEDSFFERNPDVFETAINPLHTLINEDMPEFFGEKDE